VSFYTYLLASAPYGTLYCGHTDNLISRVWKHREKVFSGFTAKYGVTRLVWYEAHGEREGAFRQERRLKKWNRAWKIRLIEAENPTWADLYEEFCGTSSADQSAVPLIAPPPFREIPVSRVSLIPTSARSREGGNPG
jgi:putative endonuclease